MGGKEEKMGRWGGAGRPKHTGQKEKKETWEQTRTGSPWMAEDGKKREEKGGREEKGKDQSEEKNM